LDVRGLIIVDMPKTAAAQIILGQPILATAGCHINVRDGRVSFEVEGRFVVFSYKKEDIVLLIRLYWMHYPFPLRLIRMTF